MNTQQAEQRAELHARILALVARLSDGSRDDAARDALLSDLHAYQRTWVAPFASFCAQRPQPEPALPCDAFRFARISSRDASDDVRTFQSSGTTQGDRSQHNFADLSLYDAAAQAAARLLLFPDLPHIKLLILAPRESELRESSLSYMLARFTTWFGDGNATYIWPIDAQGLSLLQAELKHAEKRKMPVALLGTSFAFVHAMDALEGGAFQLPQGSRIMQTGGFKGRSRELSPQDMRQALHETFGVAERAIVAEYGMTELSSQLYENTLRDHLLGNDDTPRGLWSPGWLRVSVVHHETLLPLPEGELGLVRLDDAANLDSVCALQTADLGVMQHGRLTLHGRAQGAVARGCSITAKQLLTRAP